MAEQSAAQIGWMEIAEDVRNALAQYAKINLPNVEPDGAAKIMDALNTAFWLEHNAASFDAKVAREKAEPWESQGS